MDGRQGHGRHAHSRGAADHQARDGARREGRSSRATSGARRRGPIRRSRSCPRARASPSSSASRCTSRRIASATRRRRSSTICATGRSVCSRTCASTRRRRRTTRRSPTSSKSSADVYVDDAFGAVHRAHASVHALREADARARLRLLAREGDRGARQARARRRRSRTSPSSAARRCRDKIAVVEALLQQVDALLIGGAMANTFLAATGKDMKKSLVEGDKLALARTHAREGARQERRARAPGRRRRRRSRSTRPRVASCSVDAMRRRRDDARHRSEDASSLRARRFADAKTVFWNGPMGLFEKAPFSSGTFGVARALAASQAFTVVGGGDSAAAVHAAGERRRQGHEAHLDRRRRLARADRREEAARHRGSSRRDRMNAATTSAAHRGQLEDAHRRRRRRRSSRCRCARSRRTCRTSICSSRRRTRPSRRSPTSSTARASLVAGAERPRQAARRLHGRDQREHARTRPARPGSSSATASGASTSARRTQDVAVKIAAALDHSLTPIVCVGETLEEREAGKTLEVVKRQLDGDPRRPRGRAPRCAIAYEPVWAIGTGKNASPDDAEEVHAAIRGWLAKKGEALAERTRILYGGSVKADNAAGLLAEPNVDGALVGGASLDAGSFGAIAKAAESLAKG